MKAYSLDLRERVAVACGQTGQTGQTGRQVAVRFSVSVSFVEKRLHRQRTSGSLVVPAAQRPAPCLDTPAHVGLGLACASNPVPPGTSCGCGWPRRAGRTWAAPRWDKQCRRWTGGQKKGVHAAERGTKRVIALRGALVKTLQTQDFTCFKFVDEMRTAHFVLAPTGPIAVVTPAPRAGSTPPGPRPCTAGRT